MEPGPELEATFREILRHEVILVPSGDDEWRSATSAPSSNARIFQRSSRASSDAPTRSTSERPPRLEPAHHLRRPGWVSGRPNSRSRWLDACSTGIDDGVWLVDLAMLVSAETIPHEVLTRLGLREQPDLNPVTSLATLLEQRTLLLVLDNCEHLVDATADLVQTLLCSCPSLSVLATSRELLNCDSEQACSVPSLHTPHPDNAAPIELLLEHDAVTLFVERARKARRSFALTPENARAVTELCCSARWPRAPSRRRLQQCPGSARVGTGCRYRPLPRAGRHLVALLVAPGIAHGESNLARPRSRICRWQHMDARPRALREGPPCCHSRRQWRSRDGLHRGVGALHPNR